LLDLLHEALLEYTREAYLLIKALDVLDSLGHPMADMGDTATRERWIDHHVHRAVVCKKIHHVLAPHGYELPERFGKEA
jgi:hypothetical protein